MTVGIRHDDLRRRNRAMVILAVRHAGQASRTEIAATTALSHSTISAISSDLIGEGVLAEVKGGEGGAMKRGRPQVAISLNPSAASVCVVVLSLNSLIATVVDYAGCSVAEESLRLPTLSMPRDELIGQTVGTVVRLIEKHSAKAGPVMRIILAIQGITDSESRTLMWSPITPESDICFADLLEQATGIPATVENDCNMIALALRSHDPERYRNDFIAILLSHGIGMGMVLRGEVFTGTQSSGGEFGHMIHRPDGALCRCGRRGCVEAYAGNYAILRNAEGLAEDTPPVADVGDGDIAALADKARRSPGPEREAFRKAGEALGFSLGSLFALLDPAPVAMVGHGSLAFDLLEGPIREAIAKTAGGQHSKAISFATEPNEIPLIREGCAIRALTFLDEHVFAAGMVNLGARKNAG
ncbi:ROK family protein [Mesorhizobium sp. BAC0120]|uniref:ROK family protein n=1 Tax=Mesorhizobium sp. BAC0120 TaxID=3090670 RepID=UPI00298D346C|nr:ROK family protein [Mesorhizobium sp. BAC0120]MDW6022036.1 ROK family protein [Mesorhizobium sp. BAC0120]